MAKGMDRVLTPVLMVERMSVKLCKGKVPN